MYSPSIFLLFWQNISGLYVFGISACPRAYPEGNTTGVICGLMDNPITSPDSKLVYQNTFCQECWKGFVQDDIVNYLTKDRRECIPNLIDTCKEGGSIQSLKLCEKYSRPILYKPKSQYFKNTDCAFCYYPDGNIINDIDCYQPSNYHRCS